LEENRIIRFASRMDQPPYLFGMINKMGAISPPFVQSILRNLIKVYFYYQKIMQRFREP
jgi:hypothetical protein